MAHLFKPQIVRWVKAGRRCKPNTPGAERVVTESKKWYAKGSPLPPGKKVPLATHKRVAEQLLAELVERAERGIHGLPDRDAGRRPLAPLVAEFEQALGRKAGEKHTAFVVLNVRRVLAGCKLAAVPDLLAPDLGPRVEAFVWGLAEGEMSAVNAATVGKHARQFTRWLWRKRKVLDHDPLAGVDLPAQAGEGKRRALAPAELAALIDAADASPHVIRGLTGPERAALYLTAAATGYRAGELAVVTPAHVLAEAEVPTIRLPGDLTKNGKDADQPVPPAVLARLRPLLASRPPDAPLWPGNWWERAADMFRADLAAANVPEVVNGEAAVFHSLRHTYGTMLGRLAPIKVVQELARHSTPVLTIGRYGHTGMGEKAEAVNALPLPGSDHAAGPFATLPRADLERYAEGVTTLLAALVGATLVVPMVVPDREPAGDSVGRRGTNQTVKGRNEKRRKG